MKKSEFNLTKNERQKLSDVLSLLYNLEDSTRYECKAITKAIDRLQTLLNP
jgi:hypothetical protein